jgi:hypothetical protein
VEQVEQAMSKPRVTTAEQDAELAAWYTHLRSLGSVQQKARELGISVCAVYDAIARGQGKPTAGARFKVRDHVPRESIDSESIELTTKGAV